MHVFDDDDQRPSRRGLQEQLAQDVERPRLDGFRAQRVGRRCRLHDADQPEKPDAGVGRQPLVGNDAVDRTTNRVGRV